MGASKGAGAVGATPLFAAAPNRFATQRSFHSAQVAGTAQVVGTTHEVAGTAMGAGTFSCSATQVPLASLSPLRLLLELDGGPGGSDPSTIDAAIDLQEGSEAESSARVCTRICTWWEIICSSMLARSREMRRLARFRERRR